MKASELIKELIKLEPDEHVYGLLEVAGTDRVILAKPTAGGGQVLFCDEEDFRLGDIVSCYGDGDEWEVTEADYPLLKTTCIKVGSGGRDGDREKLGEPDMTTFSRRELVRRRFEDSCSKSPDEDAVRLFLERLRR
jgi:hypothetical protein